MAIPTYPRRSPRNHPGSSRRTPLRETGSLSRSLHEAFAFAADIPSHPEPPITESPASLDASNLPPNSEAGHNSDGSTQEPASAHPTNSDLPTLPPSSEAQRASDLPTQAPIGQVIPSGDCNITPVRARSQTNSVITSPAPRALSTAGNDGTAHTNTATVRSSLQTSQRTIHARQSMEPATSSSTTQPANSVSRRFSDMSTQRAGSSARRFSELTTQRLESGPPVIGIVATQAPDSDAIGPSELSTQSPERMIRLGDWVSLPSDSGTQRFNHLGMRLLQRGIVRIAPAPTSVEMERSDEGATDSGPGGASYPQVSEVDGAPLTLSPNEALRFGFNFLLAHTDVVLRKVLRIWRRKVGGTKTERVSRGYLYFRLCLRGGKEAADIFSHVGSENGSLCKDFASWVREKRDNVDALKPVPSDEELMSTFRPAEREHWHECEAEEERRRQMVEDGEQSQGDSSVGGDRGLGDGNGTADFTISHFARLCLILRDDDQARLAHAGTGQPLTKGQQQNRLSRSDYWETVADRFNDAALTPQVDMHGAPVGEIDPSLAPTSPVPGGRLKKIWYDMRGPFTIAHNNFEKSGQHNGTLSRFLDFVQGNGHGDLYAVSKRCVTMFVVMRVGSDIPGQRVEGMLGLTLRIIPQGAGFDESGGGLRRAPGDQQSPGSSSDGDGDYLRGKRRKKNIGEDTRYLCDHIQGLTNSISNHGENDRQRGESMVGQVGRDGNVSVAAGGARQSNGNAEFQALEYMETRIKAIDLLKRSYAQVVDAETETGGGDNPMYVKTKQTYESISQTFERAFGPV